MACLLSQAIRLDQSSLPEVYSEYSTGLRAEQVLAVGKQVPRSASK